MRPQSKSEWKNALQVVTESRSPTSTGRTHSGATLLVTIFVLLSATGCSALARQKAQEVLSTGFEKARVFAEQQLAVIREKLGKKGDPGQASNTPGGSSTGHNYAPPVVVEENVVADRGRALYNATCARCHGADPKQAGINGPETVGISLEVMVQKITKGSYPPGYKPKRDTSNMSPMPHLEKEQIEALHAYINDRK